MIRFFRKNDPFRLVFVFVFLIIIRLIQTYFISGTSYYGMKWLLLGEWLGNGYSMYSETYDYTGPIAMMIYKWLDFIFGRSYFAHQLLSSVLIILQAGIFNKTLLKNKVYNENIYLPAFLYMVIATSIPDFMSLSPQLISLTFVLLTLDIVLRRINNLVTDELFLKAGVYIGIATLIYLPSFVFLFVFFSTFILFSGAILRRLLIYIFGFIIIVVIYILYFYVVDDYEVFMRYFLIDGIFLSSLSSFYIQNILPLLIPYAFICFLSILITWSIARLTSFQQKVKQVLWIMFFGGLSTFILSNEQSGHEIIFLTPFITYFLTHYFILIRRKLFKTLMPTLILAGLLCFSCYAYQNLTSPFSTIPNVQYNEGTLILGENINAYSSIPMNSPCFQQQLSEKAFNGIDYFNSSGEVYSLLKKIDPLYIVDELNIMNNIMFRYPYFEKNYIKISDNKFKKISY